MHSNEKNKQLIFVATVFCFIAIFFSLSMVFFVYNSGLNNNPITRRTIGYLSALILAWIVNLVNFIYLEPFLNKWIKKSLGISYLTSFILFAIFEWLIWKTFLTKVFTFNSTIYPLGSGLAINAFIILMIEVVFYRYQTRKNMLELSLYKMVILEAEHEKLKNQLHPHFLFNSLNALKILIKRSPDEAQSYLMKLAEFLRFSISHNEQNLVPLREELKFSLYYLEMQKTRFKDDLLFKIEIPEALLDQVQLPVFSLQLLLENALKHNNFTKVEPLKIVIQYSAPGKILVINNLNIKSNSEAGAGLGLKNLSKRYQLLIQEDIVVDINKEFFTVELKTIPI